MSSSEPGRIGGGDGDGDEPVGAPPIPLPPQLNPDAPSDIPARIFLYDRDETVAFKHEFRAPTIDIAHERGTADHEVISGFQAGRGGTGRPEFMVHALGVRPPEITITGWLAQDQLRVADNIVSSNVVGIATARYIGLAVPRTVDIPYSRTYHDKHGWLFETDMEFFAVDWSGIPLADESSTENLPTRTDDIFN